jgi:hypothetical protein
MPHKIITTMGNTFNTIYQFFVCKAKENIKLYVYIDKITCIWKASIVWDPINSCVQGSVERFQRSF